MDLNSLTWAIPSLIFASVGFFVFFLASTLFERRKVRERYGAAALAPGGGTTQLARPAGGPRIDLNPQRLGLDAAAQKRLRTSLIRAGYFSPHAVAVYTIVRTAFVVLLPLLAYWLVQTRFGHWTGLLKFGSVGGSFILAYYIGQAYLDRRQRLFETKYRLFFPDFLDMLVVCVDAGLSLEAALERVCVELGSNQRTFRTNLQLMMAEMRAGKSTIDALRAFGDRLGIDEAKSLVTLLQQSLELGTDVSTALSTYSDEMREKRMSRAEEKAFALPVKITLPIALFILPPIFIILMTPAVIRIINSFASFK